MYDYNKVNCIVEWIVHTDTVYTIHDFNGEIYPPGMTLKHLIKYLK